MQVHVETHSSGRLDSEETSSTALFCMSTGAFRHEAQNRFVTMVSGWVGMPGIAAWERDASGLLRTLQLDDHEALVLETIVRSGFFLRPQARAHLVFHSAHAVATRPPETSARAVTGGSTAAVNDVDEAAQVRRANVAASNHDAEGRARATTADATPQSNSLEQLKAMITERHLLKRMPWAQQRHEAQHAGAPDAEVDANQGHGSSTPHHFASRLGLAAEVTHVELRVSLTGGQCVATICIDAATWTVSQLRQRSMGALDVWRYGGWCLWQEQFWFPQHVSHLSAEDLVEDMAVQSCTLHSDDGDSDTTRFQRPPMPMWPPGTFL